VADDLVITGGPQRPRVVPRPPPAAVFSGSFAITGSGHTAAGTMTVGAGNIMTLRGGGSLLSCGGLHPQRRQSGQGVLILDNSSTNIAGSGRVGDAAVITLAGQTLFVGNGTAATTETIGALAVNTPVTTTSTVETVAGVAGQSLDLHEPYDPPGGRHRELCGYRRRYRLGQQQSFLQRRQRTAGGGDRRTQPGRHLHSELQWFGQSRADRLRRTRGRPEQRAGGFGELEHHRGRERFRDLHPGDDRERRRLLMSSRSSARSRGSMCPTSAIINSFTGTSPNGAVLSANTALPQIIAGQSNGRGKESLTVTFGGTVTGGSYLINLGGVTSQRTFVPATARADLQAAIEAIVGAGNVTVVGPNAFTAGAAYTVSFTGSVAGIDLPAMTVNGTSLTGTKSHHRNDCRR